MEKVHQVLIFYLRNRLSKRNYNKKSNFYLKKLNFLLKTYTKFK